LREQDNQRLIKRIKDLHHESDGVMGSLRIFRELRYQGERCGKNRIARLMRRCGLQGIPQKKRWKRRNSGIRPSGVINHLERDFSASEANTKWVTDITYVRTQEGWLYLCVVVDLYSSLVVGWSMSQCQDRHLVLQAVLMALWQRKGKSSVILHSDRGTQFTSDEYQRFLKQHNVICSMSAVGSCADNAAAESFFGVLKRERVNRQFYKTYAQARSDIFNYIECFYNPQKRRSRVDNKIVP